jgi:DnaJ-class molecular chaperone
MNKRYNAHKKNYVVLEEGQEFCRKCGGSGLVRKNRYDKRPFPPVPKNHMLVCDNCLGEGKIDWVEKATGKMVK